MNEQKVLIGLSTMEHIRKADFLPYFLGLEKPIGSVMTTVHGQSPAEARNTIIKQGLEHNCTHILFMDDDMLPPPDSLNKLLAHDKEIVSGLYLMRAYPHFPVAFDEAFENGFNKFLFMKPEVAGLIPITNCGLGFVLIKTEVFKAMEQPWVRLGEIIPDGWCDDVGFFNRVRKAGFQTWLDTDCRIGHMSSQAIWPNYVGGNWVTEYKNVNGNVLIPQTIPAEGESHATAGGAMPQQ